MGFLACCVCISPSWYRSISVLGMGSMNGGWSRVVGMGVGVGVGGGWVSPIDGRWSVSAR